MNTKDDLDDDDLCDWFCSQLVDRLGAEIVDTKTAFTQLEPIIEAAIHARGNNETAEKRTARADDQATQSDVQGVQRHIAAGTSAA